MASDIPSAIPVVDFRRQSMVLEWQPGSGTWVACDVPAALVHGVALIRASQPNICVFGRGGQLHLQIGAKQYALSENSPRITVSSSSASFGLRRRFTVESSDGGVLFSLGYWTGYTDDFFSWLASRSADPKWRSTNGIRWSEGLDAAVLRSS